MLSAPSIVDYRPADHREGLLALWRRYFGAWSVGRVERLRAWQFDENPRRRERAPRILVAEDEGGRVVGHISGIPLPLQLDRRRFIALATSGLVVDEDHRWLGLKLIGEMCRTPPVLGRASHESVRRIYGRYGAVSLAPNRTRWVYPRRYAGHLCRALRRLLPPALDWLVAPEIVGPLSPWYQPKKKPRRMRRPRRIARSPDVRPIERFGAEYDALWDRARSRWRCSLEKDARYMNWRYLACPFLNSIRRGLYDASGTLRAVAVGLRWVTTDRSQRPCGATGEIADLITDDPDTPGLDHLVLDVFRDLDGHRVDAVEAGSLHPSLHPVLRRLGFVHSQSDVLDVALAAGQALDITDSLWYCSAADSDALYSVAL